MEQIRGLRFEHPVPVELLSDHDFVARVSTPPDLPLLGQASSGEQTPELRALGLLEGT